MILVILIFKTNIESLNKETEVEIEKLTDEINAVNSWKTSREQDRIRVWVQNNGE